jgi:hypothetical protein
MVRLLLWVALTDQSLPVVADALRQVGAQNWAEGFSDEHYGNFAHALVQTVHYLSNHEWSASTGSAWISYFMWVRPHLLAGAQYAATQQAAAQRPAERQATERQATERQATERQATERQATAQRAVAGRKTPGGTAPARDARAADVNPESAANLLDDDDEDPGYGQIMLRMTRTPRRPHALRV